MITFRSNWILIIYVSKVFFCQTCLTFIWVHTPPFNLFSFLYSSQLPVIGMSFMCPMFSTSLAQCSVVNIFHPRLEFSYIVYNLLNVISTAHCVFKQPGAPYPKYRTTSVSLELCLQNNMTSLYRGSEIRKLHWSNKTWPGRTETRPCHRPYAGLN